MTNSQEITIDEIRKNLNDIYEYGIDPNDAERFYKPHQAISEKFPLDDWKIFSNGWRKSDITNDQIVSRYPAVLSGDWLLLVETIVSPDGDKQVRRETSYDLSSKDKYIYEDGKKILEGFNISLEKMTAELNIIYQKGIS